METLKLAIKTCTTGTGGVTVRQLARTLSYRIGLVSAANNITGPLVLEVERALGLTTTDAEKPFCNEILVNHPDITNRVKEALTQREKQLKERTRDPKISRQQTKPRRRRKEK